MAHSGTPVYPVFGIIMILFFVAMAILLTVFMVFLWWRIFSKAGYSGALGLLMFVPFGILIMACILAFSQWPILNKEA